jgi:hypothetical protein
VEEQWGHLLHVGRTASVPVADVAVEACVTATGSTFTAVHKPAQEVAHVLDEGHLRDKTRTKCGGAGSGISHGRGCGGQHEEWVHMRILTSQVFMSP